MNFFGVDVSEMTNCQINELFREHDESRFNPVLKFNITERAIILLEKFMDKYGRVFGFEYALLLEDEIAKLVKS